MLYHPGKIMLVFSSNNKNIKSSDDTIQAVVRMWDMHILTLLVDKNLKDVIKEGDTVLVDYRPISEKNRMPKGIIMKIIYGDYSKKLWQIYEEYSRKQKNKINSRNSNLQRSYAG